MQFVVFTFVDGRLRRVVLLLVLLLVVVLCSQYPWARQTLLQDVTPKAICDSLLKQAKAEGSMRAAAGVARVTVTVSDKTFPLDASHWYRVGKPFHDSSITSIALAFNVAKAISEPATPTEESLIFYAQSLSGVFSPDHVQYVAATKSKSGIFITTKTFGSSEPQRTVLDGCTADCNWQSLYVVMTSSGAVARVDSFGKHVPTAAALQATLAKLETANQRHSALHVDSGIYVAGVVDSLSISMTGDYPARLSALSGEMASRLVVNGKVMDLNSQETNRGVVLEKTKEFMEHTVRCELDKPLPSVASKQRNMSDPLIVHFPVVTAISDNHLEEAEDMLLSIAAVMKDRGILVYDLGLNWASIRKLSTFGSVSVRNVRTDVFADLLRNLQEYRWKPIIIHAALQEFGGVLYSDASIRFKQSITNIDLLRNGPGFVGFGPNGTSPVGGFTHDGTLKSLGVERKAVAHATVSTGGIQIWIDDQAAVREVILNQWLGCALSSACMAPRGSTPFHCHRELGSEVKFMGCHRYDQSALSVVLWKVFHDITASSYQVNDPEDLKFATIERRPSKSNLLWVWGVFALIVILAMTNAVRKLIRARQSAVK